MSDLDKTLDAMEDRDLLKTALEVMTDEEYRGKDFGVMIKDIAENRPRPLAYKQRGAVKTFLSMNKCIWY